MYLSLNAAILAEGLCKAAVREGFMGYQTGLAFVVVHTMKNRWFWGKLESPLSQGLSDQLLKSAISDCVIRTLPNGHVTLLDGYFACVPHH